MDATWKCDHCEAQGEVLKVELKLMQYWQAICRTHRELSPECYRQDGIRVRFNNQPEMRVKAVGGEA